MNCFGLLNAWWLRTSLVIALFVGAAVYHHKITTDAYKAGYAAREAIAVETELRITHQVAKQRAEDQAKADAETKRLKQNADNLAAQQKIERAKHEKNVQDHIAAALAGREWLRVQTTGASYPIRSEASPESAGIRAAAGSEKGAYLVPESAATIYRIAGDTAQLVHDYNALLDRFNECRATANAD